MSSTFVEAVNTTDVKIVPATSTERAGAKVSENTAVLTDLRQLPAGSIVSAAELVILTSTQFPSGHLVWALDDDPAGSHSSAGGGPGLPPPPSYNFRVDFVDAATGHEIEGVTGVSSKLPALPVIPSQ